MMGKMRTSIGRRTEEKMCPAALVPSLFSKVYSFFFASLY